MISLPYSRSCRVLGTSLMNARDAQNMWKRRITRLMQLLQDGLGSIPAQPMRSRDAYASTVNLTRESRKPRFPSDRS